MRFDRVHNLTGQSAFYIADAAKSFGQKDDITILTISGLTPAVAAWICPKMGYAAISLHETPRTGMKAPLS